MPKPVPLWNNLITMAGLFLTVVALILLLTFGLHNLLTPSVNPYGAIVAYLFVPGTLVVGLAAIPFGIFVKSWRLHRKNPDQPLAFRWPRVDLSDPAQRRAAIVLALGTFILLPLVGSSGYRGYRHTESTRFCSRTCHTVMEPHAVTHAHSAHARVSCPKCHMGSGASWWVKSKLSGMPQVLATVRNTFPRPIPPEITELRPTRETCQQCHWPEKFHGAQLKKIVRYSPDEHSTRRQIIMLLKTGGYETTARAEGIHEHMGLTSVIDYVATDDRRQEIPWVRVTDETGDELIYRSDGQPSTAPRPEGIVRRFDCMDCHNRPAHRFMSPQAAVDSYLSLGKISPRLPFIKRQAAAVLAEADPDAATAVVGIADAIRSFYRDNYPAEWDALAPLVDEAVEALRQIYRTNCFPDMKVGWRTYPDNIGHLISPGCFRCHDGRHFNQHGEPISRTCDVCHTFLNPVAGSAEGEQMQEGRFVHAFKLDGGHGLLRCDQCHSGGLSPAITCTDCHDDNLPAQ